MIREKLRKWLGLVETDKKLSELEDTLISKLENLETELSSLKAEVQTLAETKAEGEELKSILHRMEKIEKELSFIHQLSMTLKPVREFSTMEEVKGEILKIISSGEEVNISELKTLLNVSWRKLYNALSELEKEKKLKRKKKKGKVIISMPQASSSGTSSHRESEECQQ